MDPSAGHKDCCRAWDPAVDRTERSLSPPGGLDRPEMSMHVTAADKHRFCQRNIDVLDIRGNCLKNSPDRGAVGSDPLWLKKRSWNGIMRRRMP